MQFMLKRGLSRRLAIDLFMDVEQHVKSTRFIRQLKANRLVEQYSWIKLHWWLLEKRLFGGFDKIVAQGEAGESLGRATTPWFLKNNMQYCWEEFSREHAYEYEEYFSLDVYDELNRRAHVLQWSLDDYYIYEFDKKGMRQIVVEDLIGEVVSSGEQKEKREMLNDKVGLCLDYIKKNIDMLSARGVDEILKQRSVKWRYFSDGEVEKQSSNERVAQ